MLDLAREVRVAVYPATGAEATLPVSDQDRQKLRDSINDAAEDFLTMRRWSFLPTTVTITTDADGDGIDNVNEDARRYRLPIGYCGLERPFLTWANGTFGGEASQRSQRDIDSLIAQEPVRTGCPQVFTVRIDDTTPSAGGDYRPAWELVLWPIPNDAYTLTVPVRRAYAPLMDLEEKPTWPPQHDRPVVALAKVRFCELWPLPEMDRAMVQQRAARLLTQAVEEDERNMPSAVGSILGMDTVLPRRIAVGEISFMGSPLTY